jgi:hypothetical protein
VAVAETVALGSTRVRRRPILALLTTLIVLACTPATPPSPTVAPTESPTPSPVADLPGALREILRAPGPYRLRMERVQTSETTTSRITGTMRVTPDAWAAEGTRTDQAVGSTMVSTATYELIWIGDSGYTHSDGPWIPFTGLFDHPLRSTADPDAGTFVDLGEVRLDDRVLLRLGYADPSIIDPVFLLAIGNELEGVVASVTYDLTPDGRLVRVQSTLSGRRMEQFGGGAVTHDATYTVIPGLPDPIEPPETDWTLYRSETLPYSFALPPGWTADADTTSAADAFTGPEGSARVGVRESPVTSTPENLVDAVRRGYAGRGAAEPGSIVPTYLGSETAVAVTYAGVHLGDGPVNVVHLVSVHDDVAYDIVWTMQPGILQAQFDLIGDVATSWSWTEGSAPAG